MRKDSEKQKLVIEGGKRLSGSIVAEGAKNAVLPFLAASVLTSEETVIDNCPRLLDVYAMRDILESLGAFAHFENDAFVVFSSTVDKSVVEREQAEKLRASVCFLGPLLSRFHHAEIAYPGGCKIGTRPIDIHLNAFRKLGVVVREYEDRVVCTLDALRPTTVNLPFPSVGATENLMMLCAVSDGDTVIKNAAKEPEVADLSRFLNAMGAKIRGAGTDEIVISGVKKLHGIRFCPLGDRIEAGTFLILTAACGGEIEIKGINPRNLSPLINILSNNTCKIRTGSDIIYLKSKGRCPRFDVETKPYPFFPTDLQAPLSALATVSKGESHIVESVFDNRFLHADGLRAFGANVSCDGRTMTVKGVKRLHGANVVATDLRGGAALVVCAMAAKGTSEISRVDLIERGYSRLDEKLRLLGGVAKKTDGV